MNRRDFVKTSLVGSAGLSLVWSACAGEGETKSRPNILWITSEDNSPLLGCYGDEFATTPNLDKFAKESVLYENAFANAPVCAPARCTLITGVTACQLGTLHMRSRYPIPESIKPYPSYLREAGYYCTNKSKTDFNFSTNDQSHWDQCGGKASVDGRKPGQPFFSIINLTVSHESSRSRGSEATHDRSKVPMAPYHPDIPEFREDWAHYYDVLRDLDNQVADVLKKLEDDGLAEDTIVFYYADHGGILPRSKRFLYETGTRVPMMIRFPEKYKHLAPSKSGSRTDRLVSFVDFAPTLLSLLGIDVPSHMEGEAFLGKQKKKERDYVYLFRGRMDERYDMMRAVRDKKYRYIRNYMPHRPLGQHLDYLWQFNSTPAWEKAYKEGKCNEVQSRFFNTPKPVEELYEIKDDPWEINNLADNPDYKKILERMREVNMKRVRDIKDPGFLPEGEMEARIKAEETTAYELVRQEGFPIERIIETAEMASSRDASLLPELIKRMEDKESCVRYWASVGCLILKEKAKSATGSLRKLLKDESPDVQVAAAEALFHIENDDSVIPALVANMSNPNKGAAINAANAVDYLGDEIIKKHIDTIKSTKKTSGYPERVMDYTMKRIGVGPAPKPSKKKKGKKK